MSPHHRLLDSVRDTRKTLYVVTGSYVVIGFLLAIFAAVNGDRMGTFLGFVIISGALVTATLFRAMSKIGLRISTMAEHIDEVRKKIRHIDAARPHLPGTTGISDAGVVDLAQIAHGNASLITAATLPRDAYPRLVTAMTEHPPAQTETSGALGAPVLLGTPFVSSAVELDRSSDRNLLANWKIALREGDYAACRAMYAVLVDTVEPRVVLRLGEQIEALAIQTEASLRKQFAEVVRNRDFDGAIAVGRDILRLMPDRAVAEEYRRLEPHVLRRRAEAQTDEEPPLRIAH